MANVDSRFGLRPIHYDTRKVGYFEVASTYGTALFIGDRILITGDSGTSGKYQLIEKAGVTGASSGVILSVEPVLGRTTPQHFSRHLPANTGGIVSVLYDPQAEYIAQANGTVTSAMYGMNADMIETHAGSTTTGLSGDEVDVTSTAPAVTATFAVKILGHYDHPQNTPLSANQILRVMINNHTMANNVVGIA